MKTLLCFIFSFFSFFSVHAQTQLWGLTTAGHTGSSLGTIFKTDDSGNNFDVRPAFPRINAGNPLYTKLVQAADSMLYGLTSKAGENAAGVLFQYNPATGIYTQKVDFKANITGKTPSGSLLKVNDGMLYGMTSKGGENNKGTLFQYNPTTSVLVKEFDFNDSIGGEPTGSLIQADDGKLYGMTSKGGIHNLGVLFSYDFNTSIYTKLFDFDGAVNGANPLGDLLLASNGMLYGITNKGGISDLGVIFQYDISNSTFSKQFEFSGPFSGYSSEGSLMQANDGMLYGVTSKGGIHGDGILFQYNINTSAVTTKFNFYEGVGKTPTGSLIQASDGMLYGTASLGGPYGKGVIFQYDPVTAVYTLKNNFATGLLMGPRGTLMQATNGKLYGLTYAGGGSTNDGLFEYDIVTTDCRVKIFFHQSYGQWPQASLLQASDGMLYGTAMLGGAYTQGVIFRYNPLTSLYTMVYEYNHPYGLDYGLEPKSSLIQASDGMLYGTTNKGGAYSAGTIFQFDPVTLTYVKKFDFDGAANGQFPEAGLVQANDGMLYGVAPGPQNGKSILYQYNPFTSVFTKMFDFTSYNANLGPGALLAANDGMLYGVTWNGGAYDRGFIYQYNPGASSIVVIYDFVPGNGTNHNGDLIQGADGAIYGLSSYGGANSLGTIFKYDLVSSSYTKLFDFDGSVSGKNPEGSVMQAVNGKLYGMTTRGGEAQKGVFFEFDPVTLSFTKKLDFSTTNGWPIYTHLIEVPVQLITSYTDSIVCAGETIALNYFNTGSFNSGNIFTAELSDALGSFASPLIIGTLSATVSDTINALIPLNTPAGNGYRIRVRSSNPAMIAGDNGNDIQVKTAPPIIALTSDDTVCAGMSVTLMGAGGTNTYTWTDGVTDGVSFVPVSTNTYIVKGSGVNNCSNTDSVTVVVSSPVVLASASDTSLCENTSVILTGSGAASYVWSGGVTDGVDFTPQATTTYTLTGTDISNCTGTDTITVVVNPAPIVTANTTHTSVCAGDFVTLSGSGAVTYSWSGGVIDTISFAPLATVTYSVTGTDTNNCMGTDSVLVLVKLPPNASIAIQGDSLISNYFVGNQWFFNNSILLGDTLQHLVALQSGDYMLVVVDSGCYDTVSYTYYGNFVWPGDTNNDSLVNNIDLLPIGLFYSTTGIPRTATSNLWTGYPAMDWGTSQLNGSDVKHADSNGDGSIDNSDTLAVNLNFNLTHAYTTSSTGYNSREIAAPLFFVINNNVLNAGDWISAEIWLGSSTMPANDVYGIALNIHYTAGFVQPGTEHIVYPADSWLGTVGTDVITIYKNDPLAGIAYGAITRIDHINKSGFGKIAEFRFQIKTSLTLQDTMRLSLENRKANDASGVAIDFNGYADSILINPLSTSTTSLYNNFLGISIFPNPFTLQTTITFDEVTENTEVKIIDAIGKMLKTFTFTGTQLIIERGELSPGVYFIQLKNGNKLEHKKIIIH